MARFSIPHSDSLRETNKQYKQIKYRGWTLMGWTVMTCNLGVRLVRYPELLFASNSASKSRSGSGWVWASGFWRVWTGLVWADIMLFFSEPAQPRQSAKPHCNIPITASNFSFTSRVLVWPARRQLLGCIVVRSSRLVIWVAVFCCTVLYSIVLGVFHHTLLYSTIPYHIIPNCADLELVDSGSSS